MSKYRVFNEKDELDNEVLNLYKFIKPSFWEMITGNDNDCWQFIRSFSSYKEVDKYARSKGLIEGDIFD
jgi:hypothetical protein